MPNYKVQNGVFVSANTGRHLSGGALILCQIHHRNGNLANAQKRLEFLEQENRILEEQLRNLREQNAIFRSMSPANNGEFTKRKDREHA